MSNGKKFLSLSCLFAAFLMVYLYNKHTQKQILGVLGSKKIVYVASERISEQDRIYIIYKKNGALLKQPETPQFSKRAVYEKYIQPGAIVVGSPEEKELLNKNSRHMTLASLEVGEQLMMSKLTEVSASKSRGLANEIAVTKRALSIPVNELTGVAKLLKPGNRVDILAGLSWKKGFTKIAEFKTVLENVHVLAVGAYTQNHVPDFINEDELMPPKENIKYSRRYQTITVEVTPTEAQILVYSLSQGQRLYLTLRNPADKVITNITTATVDEVLGENSKKAEQRRRDALKQRKPATKPKKIIKPKLNPFKQGGGVFN